MLVDILGNTVNISEQARIMACIEGPDRDTLLDVSLQTIVFHEPMKSHMLYDRLCRE